MFVRAVRFTDVSADRVDALRGRIDESEGPPPGVSISGMKMLFDQAQGTALVLQFFAHA